MEDTEKEDSLDCSDLQRIAGLNYIIRILDQKKFENFLIEEGIEDRNSLFDGFLFLAKTVSRVLLSQIGYSSSLNLQEDLTFSRAMNRGVPLGKIKNTCQKTVFIKNLHRILRSWWRSRNNEEFSKNYERVRILICEPLDKIFENNVALTPSFENHKKEDIIRKMAILCVLVYLSDTDRNYPHGYPSSLLSLNLSEKYLARVFNGYKLALVFVWKKLLEREVDLPSGAKIISRLSRSRNWQELDLFFGQIRQKIAKPIEKQVKADLAFGEFFQVTTPIESCVFGREFLRKPHQPSLSYEENLQQTLFWYPIQAMQGHLVFTGTTSFASVLAGMVTLKRLFRNLEKSYVVRFVHPENGGNSYSYAVLIESYGSIADYSGWLVFFDCATDYSGFGGSEHRFAEMVIRRYEEMDAVNVIEFRTDSERLLKYLTVFSGEITDKYDALVSKIPAGGEVKRHRKVLEQISLTSRINRLNSRFSAAKGCLLELLAFYFFTSKGWTVRWRYRNNNLIGDNEIDIVAKDNQGDIHLVSCMSSFDIEKADRLAQSAEMFCRKRGLARPDFGTFRGVRKAVFLIRNLNPEERKAAKERGALAHSIKSILDNGTCFNKAQKLVIKEAFGDQIDGPHKFPVHAQFSEELLGYSDDSVEE